MIGRALKVAAREEVWRKSMSMRMRKGIVVQPAVASNDCLSGIPAPLTRLSALGPAMSQTTGAAA